MPSYFKLGPKAISFSDPVSKVSLGTGDVVKLNRTPQNKFFMSRLKGGAIAGATEAEYNKFMGIVPEPPPPTKPTSEFDFDLKELQGMTIAEIMDEADDQEIPDQVYDSLKSLKKAQMINVLMNL